MEFKYFKTESGEEIISSGFVVGQEEFIRQKIHSSSLPKVDEKQFLNSLDKNGMEVFLKIFEFAKQKGLMIRWGSKGFSLNVELTGVSVGLFYGFPPSSVFKQSIYTVFEDITKKVNNPEDIIAFYKKNLETLDYFKEAKSNLKWVIDKTYSEEEVNQFLHIVEQVISEIRKEGLK